MTTRKPNFAPWHGRLARGLPAVARASRFWICLLPPALATLLLLAGCATPGPLHRYSTSADSPAEIHDAGSDGTTASVPSFLAVGEHLVGFAYDPFTDHFFLRLAPGDLIYTGTPEGVAAVQRGDLLEGTVAGVGTVRTKIV